MDVLLDTHALLWAIFEPKRLSRTARQTLESPQTNVFVSSATAWEVATKTRLGKLPIGQALVDAYPRYLARLTATELPVNSAHALHAGAYRNAHRDPFDRILAAQAEIEDLPFVTCDPAFATFRLNIVW
jgi:PIN domain nuclease of toxin-antitoxin system